MEKTPGTYRKLNEEEHRDVLLTLLNGQFQGSVEAVGEAFNRGGKTDLLVPHEGRNLLIGECKLWTGQQKFTEAIDQIFGYQTWRDSKLAIIVFVRRKNLTQVLESSRQALETHRQFVCWLEEHDSTEFRCQVSWPGDGAKLAELAVLFAHTPAT